MGTENTKQRLFEMMGKVDPTFKPINEVFGWSQKEKDRKILQQKIEEAKQEVIREDRLGALVFAQPATTGEQAEPKNIKRLMDVTLNGIKQQFPTVMELLPDLFEPQGYSNAVYEDKGRQKIYGLVLNNWSWVRDNDGLIRAKSGIEKLIQKLDSILQ